MKKRPKLAKSGNNGDTPSPNDTLTRPANLPFPIVGIGASAGGLEALEQFLGQVPENSGLAFVIIQHLDPTHKGIMPELHQRATGMEVSQVKARMKVNPNCVYIIPPNNDMSIRSAGCCGHGRQAARPANSSLTTWSNTIQPDNLI